MRIQKNPLPVIFAIIAAVSCKQAPEQITMDSYGYDKAFFEKHHVEFLELKSRNNRARLLVVPDWQGRVMTSTAEGDEGNSYGWINYSFIESGKVDPQFNVYGGEERFWLGPEGGPFSIYFKEGEEQVFENWKVPPVIDTEGFNIKRKNNRRVTLTREATLNNASGTTFRVGIERTVSLLSKRNVSSLLNIDISRDIRLVAYKTENSITNLGNETWTKEKGLLSIWLLSMFNPSSETTIFIPYDTSGEGKIVNDDYFGKVPMSRLIVADGMVFFRGDGMHRSKIGIPPGRAREIFGSYNPESRILTIMWFNLPSEPQVYVNSKWGEQDDPYDGDVINSYNDGPLEDGSIMGPFYELETSSPAAALKPEESLKHIQCVMHFEGAEEELRDIARTLFNLELPSCNCE